MNSESQPTDLLSKFVNWFSKIGPDQPPTQNIKEGEDIFSRIMNKLSA